MVPTVRLLEYRIVDIRMANGAVFEYFYERAVSLRETSGFDWSWRNSDLRHMLNLLAQPRSAGSIRRKLEDLARRGFIDPTGPDGGRGGGKSLANRRAAVRNINITYL